MTPAVGAARAVRLGRSARAEAAVADFVFKRCAGEVVVKVLERCRGDVGKRRLVRQERLMRGDDHVGERHEKRQRLVLPRNVRTILVEPFAFLFVHVQPGCADRAIAQCREQRLRIDKPASRGVDEREAALCLGERVGVDEVLRFGEKRTMQRDDIRLGEKPVERDIFKPRRRIRECVVGEDSHSEPLADVGEDASDLARADYACRLAVKVESRQPDKREVEVLCANGGAVDVARQRHQERGGGRYRFCASCKCKRC